MNGNTSSGVLGSTVQSPKNYIDIKEVENGFIITVSGYLYQTHIATTKDDVIALITKILS